MTVEEIYEEVWLMMKEKLCEESMYFKEENLWWRETDVKK
jgi:hypothetical protein